LNYYPIALSANIHVIPFSRGELFSTPTPHSSAILLLRIIGIVGPTVLHSTFVTQVDPTVEKIDAIADP
jgi:hypothetical protein